MLACATIANAVSGICDPDGDISNGGWAPNPWGTGACWDNIDDGIRSPDAGDTSDLVGCNQNNKSFVLSMTTILDFGNVSNVTVWVYGYSFNPVNDAVIDIFMGDEWIGAQNPTLPNPVDWKSVSFDGSWTQTDLDNMQISATSINSTGSTLEIYSLYAVVTYTAGGGGGTPTGKVIMISDEGEGTPPSGYNYDYVSVYPPAQSDDYVKATSYYADYCLPHFSTDPTKSLVGELAYNQWAVGSGNDQEQAFHVDLGSAKTVKRIYYENSHVGGVVTERGWKNFTFYGSNTAGDFSDLVYADTGDWVELTCSQNTFDQHIAADQPDPKYITVTNTTPYRYYGFKFADNWGGITAGIRRIELQTNR